VQQAREKQFVCLCILKKQQIFLQNRDARDIIIDCKICNKKQSLGYLQFHEILAQNFKTIITTKEFDVVSFTCIII
jgi:hypothetical protein